MAPSVLLCIHEYASVVKNRFMFKGGLALEERLRRGLRLYQKSEENEFFQNKRFLKSSKIALPFSISFPLYIICMSPCNS